MERISQTLLHSSRTQSALLCSILSWPTVLYPIPHPVVAEFCCGLVVQTGAVKSGPRLDENAVTDVTKMLVEAFL